jgi:hypothetical protein
VALAGERVLPLLPTLEPLFPSGGLRRGSTVVISAAPSDRPQGATSLAIALGAAASAAGSWCAAVNLPDLGLMAAADLGIALERLALVPDIVPAQWVSVVGALLDAVDVVLVRPPAHLRAGDARRLSTRARERGTVLVPVVAGRREGWGDGGDVRLRVTGGQWEGPGSGYGRLSGRQLQVAMDGRGAAARARHVELWLPAPFGGLMADDRSETGAELDAESAEAYAGADADRIPDPRIPDAGLISAG